jgi:hypothetical protein
MQNQSQQLFNILVTRNLEPEALDKSFKPSSPDKAIMFKFDWRTENQNYGSVVIMLGADRSMAVYYGDNLGRGMESKDRKRWYDFLEQLKNFSTSNDFRKFDLRDISQLKYNLQGIAALSESLLESFRGRRDVSYNGPPRQTRLMIKHRRPLSEDEPRHRCIESLFVETDSGERFRVPSRSLAHGRILARHVMEGGNPYDAFGMHVNQLMTELATMSRFLRASRGKDFGEQGNAMVSAAQQHHRQLREKVKRMSGRAGYMQELKSFDPMAISGRELVVDEIRNIFTEKKIDHRIEEALPVLARMAAPAVASAASKGLNDFSSWVDSVSENRRGEMTTGQRKKLHAMMQSPLLVGPDAMNARQALADILPDAELFSIFDRLAAKDPDINVWKSKSVLRRMRSLIRRTQESLQGAPTGGGVMDRSITNDLPEDLDTDGVMMTKPSNMSSESIDRLRYLAKV